MDSRIQAYLRFAASHQRDIKQIGPFLATFNRHNANPFLNYAIPDDGATPSKSDVAALIAAYESCDRSSDSLQEYRIPRLEYVQRLAPAVEPALTAAGFTIEGCLPLMTCTPGAEQLLPIPPGIELILPSSDAELLATVTVQNEAYGGLEPSPEDVRSLQNSLTAGGIAVLARDVLTGEPAGAGVCSVPGDATTEIAGIGVRIPFRRRGVAGAITTRLVQEAFKSGVSLAFLMAAHDAEARIYTRAGFSPIGEILHISRPRK